MDINPIHAGQVAFARCLLDCTYSQPPLPAHRKPHIRTLKASVFTIKPAGLRLRLFAPRLQQRLPR